MNFWILIILTTFHVCHSSSGLEDDDFRESFRQEFAEFVPDFVRWSNEETLLDRYFAVIRGDLGRVRPGSKPLGMVTAMLLILRNNITASLEDVERGLNIAHQVGAIEEPNNMEVVVAFRRIHILTSLPGPIFRLVRIVGGVVDPSSSALTNTVVAISQLIAINPQLIDVFDKRFEDHRKILQMITTWNEASSYVIKKDEPYLFDASTNTWRMSPDFIEAVIRRLALGSIAAYRSQLN